MRLGSETAYLTALEGWESLLIEGNSDSVELAQQVFAAVDMLGTQSTLVSVLEDSQRSGDDRAALVTKIFGQKVSGPVVDVLAGLARADWSESGDYLRSLERLGVQTLLIGAQREGVLSEVESEVYNARRLLASERDLRLALSDETYDLPARTRLVDTVFGGQSRYGRELLLRALTHVRQTSLARTLTGYLEEVAERGRHLVASVTAALPLTREQEERLVRVLEKRYGKDVKLHTTIDRAVLGGVRVHIGDDVIDGTIANRINQVKEQLSSGR